MVWSVEVGLVWLGLVWAGLVICTGTRWLGVDCDAGAVVGSAGRVCAGPGASWMRSSLFTGAVGTPTAGTTPVCAGPGAS